MDKKGYYNVLGLSAGASEAEIKKAYSRKILEYHPDQGRTTKKVKAMPEGPEKDKKMKEIEEKIRKLNEAKNVLGDSEKKKLYDQGIDENAQAGFDMGGFDIFDFMGGGGRRRDRGPKKVTDTEFQVKFTLKDAFTGRRKTFNVKRDVICQPCSGRGGKDSSTCSKCQGKGEYQVKRQMGFMITIDTQKCEACDGLGSKIVGPPCTTCKGKRYLNKTESVTVEFKKGFQNGETLVVKGKGDEYVGCISGDLVLTAVIEENPHFKRIDNHLVMKADVDLAIALSGGTISLRHIDDSVLNIQVAPLQNLREDVYLVRNAGFPGGNLYIEPSYTNISSVKKNLSQPKPPKGGVNCAASNSKMPRQQTRESSGGFKETIFSSFFGGF